MSEPMTALDAMLILYCYQHVAYKNPAVVHVVSQARKTIDEAGKAAMEAHVGTLCTVCWGDGFHRPSANILRGPCEACEGTGRRALVGMSEDLSDGLPHFNRNE